MLSKNLSQYYVNVTYEIKSVEWVSKIIDVLKLPKKLIAIIFIVVSILLFLPESVVNKIHLKQFIETFGFILGITFILTGSMLIWEIVSYFWNLRKTRLRNEKRVSVLLSDLNSLDPSEKSLLREFYIQQRNTIKLPADNPIVAGLLQKKVLVSVGEIGRSSIVGILFSYKISDLVFKYLDENLHLGFPIGEPTETEREFIIKNRLNFIRQIIEQDSLNRYL